MYIINYLKGNFKLILCRCNKYLFCNRKSYLKTRLERIPLIGVTRVHNIIRVYMLDLMCTPTKFVFMNQRKQNKN